MAARSELAVSQGVYQNRTVGVSKPHAQDLELRLWRFQAHFKSGTAFERNAREFKLNRDKRDDSDQRSQKGL